MEENPMNASFFAINDQTVRLIDASVLIRALNHVREGLRVLHTLKPPSSETLHAQYSDLLTLYEAEVKRRGLEP